MTFSGVLMLYMFGARRTMGAKCSFGFAYSRWRARAWCSCWPVLTLKKYQALEKRARKGPGIERRGEMMAVMRV